MAETDRLIDLLDKRVHNLEIWCKKQDKKIEELKREKARQDEWKRRVSLISSGTDDLP